MTGSLTATAVQLLPLLPPRPLLEAVERLLCRCDSWQFDTLGLQEISGGHALSALGFFLMQREGLVERFRMEPLRLARLLRTLESGYPASNPYHNSAHAADVLHTLHVLLHGAQLTEHYLDKLGLMAAYFAAIVHDYGHPGLTNDFLVATSHPLALRYNDRSPLESHHAAAAFTLLADRPDLDVTTGLSAAERAAFRKQARGGQGPLLLGALRVVELVLATDMKQHFAILNQFNTGPSGGMVEVVAPVPLNEGERLLTLQVMLKASDIGHLGASLDRHKRWLTGLEEEFFRQGDQERQRGLPVSPLFDRAKQGVSKSQVGFYDFVALPLVRAVAEAFPGALPLLRCFSENYKYWKKAEAAAAAAGGPGAAGGPAAASMAGTATTDTPPPPPPPSPPPPPPPPQQ
ncbi:3'5'-cyclic nucleotide phosphodiesterase [Volvox carteri f. nagariensis]|uniref:3'5'-cyclic nucleotide phosphodiesterase n=1 Tax=Volvox carteri f. nagariensis TaxID=3068 RepID=D8U1K4_VOLCA|nr:3'5'-cyclic nucleotide phosphodiesterase [Volvox carteri f. nagariensis]EFJ46356.1 3'5'-cyclic nucleotide phosphodiesterase [Volvox carteri f. nagariensis]|eukprot:XP_002952509.1 3'5'-cyclic nucleotide phosphodiesterase [Volvox carteri f. nagariensis]